MEAHESDPELLRELLFLLSNLAQSPSLQATAQLCVIISNNGLQSVMIIISNSNNDIV